MANKRMWRVFVMTVFCVQFAILCAGAEDQQQQRTAESADYRATFIEPTAPAQGTAPSFLFEIFDKHTQRTTTLKVQNKTTAVRHFRIVSDKLVIFGTVENISDIVTVEALLRPAQSVYFLCYGPQLSPSGHFIVYKRFYPRFSDPQLMSDVLILFDTSEDPAHQELREAGNSRWSPGDPLGYVIFPEWNCLNQSVQVWIEDPSLRHHIVSSAGYLWTDSDDRLIFVESFKNSHWLVSVDFAKGIAHSEIRRTEFEVPDSEVVAGLAVFHNAINIRFASGVSTKVSVP